VRRALLSWLAGRKGEVLVGTGPAFDRQKAYDRLADAVRGSLDMRLVYSLVGLGEGK
jgi:hypothetical protein